jgi:hypothetical protein
MPTFTVTLTDSQAAALSQFNLVQENAARRSPQNRGRNLSQLSLAEYVTALITGPANESLGLLTEEKAAAVASQFVAQVRALPLEQIEALFDKVTSDPSFAQEKASEFVGKLQTEAPVEK